MSSTSCVGTIAERHARQFRKAAPGVKSAVVRSDVEGRQLNIEAYGQRDGTEFLP